MNQLNTELSEKATQVMMKDNELKKLKEDNSSLRMKILEVKDNSRTETKPQVGAFIGYLV